MRQVGRPAERDSQGNRISKCLVNVTIPTKLRDFLSENKINRSKLFTSVVTRLYMHQICPKCYNENIVNGIMALSVMIVIVLSSISHVVNVEKCIIEVLTCLKQLRTPVVLVVRGVYDLY